MYVPQKLVISEPPGIHLFVMGDHLHGTHAYSYAQDPQIYYQPPDATGEEINAHMLSRHETVGQAHAQGTAPDAAACASAALRRSLRERSAAAQACECAAAAACMASIWRSSGRVASGMADASSSWRASAAWPLRVMSASSRFSMSSLQPHMQVTHSFPDVMGAK